MAQYEEEAGSDSFDGESIVDYHAKGDDFDSSMQCFADLWRSFLCSRCSSGSFRMGMDFLLCKIKLKGRV